MASEDNGSISGQKTKGFFPKSLLLSLVFGVVLVAALGSAVYFYMQYQKSQSQTPAKGTAEEIKNVVGEVGKIMVLPTDETPQVATVSDMSKLKGQLFFAQAVNGDIVLIYTKAAKAILYDPRQKKVVEVGPINLTQPSPTAAPTPANLKVILRNGTTKTGFTSIIEKQLKPKFPNITVVEKANAEKSSYEQTTVVDLTGKQTAVAAQLAKELNGVVGALPAGESKPTVAAGILVILGKQ